MDSISNQTRLVNAAEPSRFAYIDAIRGLAFLGVLTVHAAYSVGDFPGRSLLLDGRFGVQLFFLASAITLCHSMSVRRKTDQFPVLSFYLRRLFRIAPLFWVALIFYSAFPQVMPSFWLTEWAPQGVHSYYYGLTALFLHGWHPYTFDSIVPGGWSIAVEMTFYLFFPVFFFYLGKNLKGTALVVLASILYFKALGHVERWLHTHYFQEVPDKGGQFFTDLWFPAQLPVFLIGFLAFHLITNPRVGAVVKNRVWAIGLFCICGVVLLSVVDLYHAFIPNLLLIVLTLGAICVIYSGEALPGLVNPAIRYLGKISYSCYLVHFAALGITLNLFGIHHLTADAPSFDTGQATSNLVLFVGIMLVSLVFTVVISIVTMHLIENPGIALGRKIIRRLNTPTNQPS